MKRLLLISVFALSVLAQPTGEIVHRFSAEMNRPTDIAILEDGRICVADGVNARVVIFQPNGVFKALTLPGMKRPLGLASDVGGGLLISDTEADAIFILDHNLNLKVQLPLASEIDATDILPVNDHLWVVDNDGHRVLVMDRKGRIKQEVGRKGSAGPTLNYPATISFGKNQQIYICDVLNGRYRKY